MDEDELAIHALMNRGYTLDQATQMHYQQKDRDAIAADAAAAAIAANSSRSVGNAGGTLGGGTGLGARYNDASAVDDEGYYSHGQPQPQFPQRYPQHNASFTNSQARSGSFYGSERYSDLDEVPHDSSFHEETFPRQQQMQPQGHRQREGSFGTSASNIGGPRPTVGGRNADEHAIAMALVISQQEAMHGR